jgi:glycosyltransferase involved in cell wall biosynthesis
VVASGTEAGAPRRRGATQQLDQPSFMRSVDLECDIIPGRRAHCAILAPPEIDVGTPCTAVSSARLSSLSDRSSSASELPVCVVVPAYNRADRLERSLASVWAQRPVRPKEVIVVDDHSTDDTAAVATSLGARVVRHTENRGPAEARNTALHATNCEWIAFLDSDDEWLPHHLAHLWSIRGQHALVGGSAYYLTGDGRGDRFSGPVSRRPMEFRSPDRLISTHNFFTTSGSMVRREAALAVGGFHKWWGAEDFDLWLRVLEQHTGICSRCVTVLYHIHDAQLSVHTERMLKEHREVVKAHIDRTGRSAEMLERWEATVAWDRLRAAQAAGRHRDALRYIPDVLSGRQRLIGLASQLWLRVRVRRRKSRLDRRGRPSIALLLRGADERAAVLRILRDPPVRDLSARATRVVLFDLLRHPAGLVITATTPQAALLRLAGNRAIPARRVMSGSFRLDHLVI